MDKQNKSILDLSEKIKFRILGIVAFWYEGITGKSEYKISFTVWKRKYRIEKKYSSMKSHTEKIEEYEVTQATK